MQAPGTRALQASGHPPLLGTDTVNLGKALGSSGTLKSPGAPAEGGQSPRPPHPAAQAITVEGLGGGGDAAAAATRFKAMEDRRAAGKPAENKPAVVPKLGDIENADLDYEDEVGSHACSQNISLLWLTGKRASPARRDRKQTIVWIPYTLLPGGLAKISCTPFSHRTPLGT